MFWLLPSWLQQLILGRFENPFCQASHMDAEAQPPRPIVFVFPDALVESKSRGGTAGTQVGAHI